MIRIVTIDDVRDIIQRVTLPEFFQQLFTAMTDDFKEWQAFTKSPRYAAHFPYGVMELMPICGPEYFAYKFVNGHPGNPRDNKLTVVATGMLAENKSGYPLLISEMTILTAMRTAVTSALASHYLAKRDSKVMALIGTGSQAEFQVLAHHVLLGIEHVKYYDIDGGAMEKFANNMQGYEIELQPCQDVASTIVGADIITTATADKNRLKILHNKWITAGVHINAIGGDCPGKTELEQEILARTKLVVEYLPQSKIEGEIQGLEDIDVYAELWELVQTRKPGRVDDQEITLFDSVGFALEDHSVLRLIYQLSERFQIGQCLPLIPELDNPKNLFKLVM